MWLRNVLDDDRNVEIPCPDSLVIGRGDKPAVLVNESNGIDRSKMLVVLLSNFA